MGRRPDDVPAARHRRPAGRRGRSCAAGTRRPSRRSSRAPRTRTATSKIGVERASVRKALGGGQTRSSATGPSRRPRRATRSRRACSRSSATPTSRPRARRAATRGCAPAASSRSTASASASSGDYALASTRHVFRGTTGYQTHFTISGRSPRTLDRSRQPRRPRRSFGRAVVVGIVTQNDDPEQHGPRARQVSGARRRRRGLVGADRRARRGRRARPADAADRRRRGARRVRARRRAHPYMLGSLWNGTDMPGDLAQTDGSYALHSDQKIDIAADKAISVKGDGHARAREQGRPDGHDDGDGSTSEREDVKIKGDASISIEAGTTHHDQGLVDLDRGLDRRGQRHGAARMSDNLVGAGIAFPLRVDRAAASRSRARHDDVDEAIRLIVGTAPGGAADAARVRLRRSTTTSSSPSTRTRSAGSTTRSASRSTAGSRASTSSTSTSTRRGRARASS